LTLPVPAIYNTINSECNFDDGESTWYGSNREEMPWLKAFSVNVQGKDTPEMFWLLYPILLAGRSAGQRYHHKVGEYALRQSGMLLQSGWHHG
jgi:hypothetical protein